MTMAILLGFVIGVLASAWAEIRFERRMAASWKKNADAAVAVAEKAVAAHGTVAGLYRNAVQQVGPTILVTDSGVWINGQWVPPGRHELPLH